MSVILSYLHSEQVSHSFMDSIIRVYEYESSKGRAIPERSAYRTSPMEIPKARNNAMSWLVASGAEWLWMVDTDMGFKEDCLERLRFYADPVEAPVVSALCWAQFRQAYDGMGGYGNRAVPTLYNWEKLQNGNWYYTLPYSDMTGNELPKNEMVRVAATGAACLLIHRSAAEQVLAKYGKDWFTPFIMSEDRKFGEDISFCHRLRELDIPLFVHTGIPTTHHKYVYLGGE